jgi:ParB-like chromosome segregation protein Spo0J
MVAINISELTPHPRNVRQGDIGAISVSLETFGQYRPIIYQKKTKHIIAGNHTWKAAKQLGWKTINAEAFDCDDDTALRILIADNRATDLATYDDTALLELLKELAATEKKLDGTLFEGDDLQRLVDDTTPPPLPPEPTTTICPECGATFQNEK